MNDLLPSICKEFPWQNFRSKTLCFLLYPEWDNFNEIVISLKNSSHDFLAIGPLHNMDVKEDGTPDKPHYHGIISFHSQVWAYAFCKNFGISVMPEALKNKFGDRRSFLLYLTHSDEKSIKAGKVQYSFEDIYSDKPNLIHQVYNTPLVYKPDIIDTCSFLKDMEYRIQAYLSKYPQTNIELYRL